MKEELISFDTAKLAKEKGFDWEVNAYYFDDGILNKISYSIQGDFIESIEIELDDLYENKNKNCVTYRITKGECLGCKSKKYSYTFSAPTQSLLQKWLREKHNIHIMIRRLHHYLTLDTTGYSYMIFNKYGAVLSDDNNNETYEEALEKALQEALNLI